MPGSAMSSLDGSVGDGSAGLDGAGAVCAHAWDAASVRSAPMVEPTTP
jgi:hypothetical protein